MVEIGKVSDVGAPDPEHRNSPIFNNNDSDDLSLDLKLEEGVCFFNNESHPNGAYVCSGNELLHREERGVGKRGIRLCEISSHTEE